MKNSTIPSVELIKGVYKDAEIIESVRGNNFIMEYYDINSIKVQGSEIFIESKDGSRPARCLYDHDTETKAKILK